jgi:Icc-related predicted phosphoesterase
MKILAISDQVVDNLYSPNVKDRFGDIDLIIGCGDLPHYYLEFLTTILNRPLYYVNGNHDTPMVYTELGQSVVAPRGCEPLDECAVVHNGIILAGLSGSIRYNYQSKFQFTQEEMDAKATRLALRLIIKRLRYGRWLDVLVTHSPPLGVGDGPDHAHTGFRSFHTLMRRFKPRYLLHGHQHTYRGQQPAAQVGSTRVLNVYPYRVIEWE